MVCATKRFSPRSGRFDGKSRRGRTTTQDQDAQPTAEIEGSAAADANVDDGYFLPDLPGEEPDFWEGPQWDWLGFFVEYLWAFSVVFAVITNNLSPSKFCTFYCFVHSIGGCCSTAMCCCCYFLPPFLGENGLDKSCLVDQALLLCKKV